MTTFKHRADLEEAIETCSATVRLLQEKAHNGTDGDGPLADVAEELKKLVALRKALKMWKQKERRVEEGDRGTEETEETGEESKGRMESAAREQEDGRAALEDVREAEEGGNGAAVAKDELLQRAIRLEELVAAANVKLTTLEGEVAQVERTKKALTYLVAHQEPMTEQVGSLVECRGTTKEGAGSVRVEVTTPKKKKKKRRKNKVATGEGVDEQSEELPGDDAKVEIEAEYVNRNTTMEKLQEAVVALTEEKNEAVVKLMAELADQRAEMEQQSQEMLRKAKHEFDDVEEKLRRTVASVAQEKDAVIAKLKAELEEQRVDSQLAGSQEVESELVKTVAALKHEKAELERKLQTAEEAAKCSRDELENVQDQLTDSEDRETQLRKLRKSVEDVQLANKKLTEENALIEADAKAIRDEAEKRIAEHLSSKSKSESSAAKIAAIAAELEASKTEVQKLQAKVKKLTSEASASHAKVSSTKERILTLEQELAVATKIAEEASTELEQVSKAAQKSAEEMSAELESLRALSQDSASKLAISTERVQTLEKDLEAVKKEREDALAELEGLRTCTKDTELALLGSNERMQVLEKELELAQHSAQEASTERDALRTSMQEAERMYKAEIEKLTMQVQTTEGSCKKEFIAELEKAKDAAKVALADKEEAACQLRALTDKGMRLQHESEKALSLASRKSVQAEKLAADLSSRSAEVTELKAQYDELLAQYTRSNDKLLKLQGGAATNDDLLKKARVSLLEVTSELKEARADSLKWKNSAQAAKTLMNAKIADAESAYKQLKKARADAASAKSAHLQLSASLEGKEKKLARAKQELATVRSELTETIKTFEANLVQMKQAHAARTEELGKASAHTIAQLTNQIQSYRLMLVVVLLPALIATFVYAISI
ncbi:unnamed protein product [Hyaloperonospora brassicae]|uniref:Uncharacterized protein n=1 Tax=Hyaloperonospora brassicae TaxID=162125 RepID=A0AAV0UJ63_HYABA|nr:unnamed protein product [Hyaloperonospora brassicae]